MLNAMFQAAYTASPPTSLPRTWASTWRATASWTTRHAARPPGRRSSAGTTPPSAGCRQGQCSDRRPSDKHGAAHEPAWHNRKADRPVIAAAGSPGGARPASLPTAIQLPDGDIVTGKTISAPGRFRLPLLLNALKAPGRAYNEDMHLISPIVIEPIQRSEGESPWQPQSSAAHATRCLSPFPYPPPPTLPPQVAMRQLDKLQGL